MAQPDYKTETDILHSIARDHRCRLWFTNHAKQQMAARKIYVGDIQEVLTNGHIELIERKADDVARVRGTDLDGSDLVVACVVFEDFIAIRIVTTF